MTTEELDTLGDTIATDVILAWIKRTQNKGDFCSVSVLQSCEAAVRRCQVGKIADPVAYIRTAAWNAAKKSCNDRTRFNVTYEPSVLLSLCDQSAFRDEQSRNAKEDVDHILHSVSDEGRLLIEAILAYGDVNTKIASALNLSIYQVKRRRQSLRKHFTFEENKIK